MTVLHIIEPFAGGVTTFIGHLASHLPQHRHIVVHGRRTSVDQIESVRRRFPAGVEFEIWEHAQREINIWRDFRALMFLIRLLRKKSFDVVHLHSSKAGSLGRIACFFLGIQAVLYTPHAAPFMRRDISGRTRGLYIFLEKLATMLPGPVVCCCQEELREYQKVGIRALCINNGTNITTQEQKPQTNGNVVIMCSALITRQKNPGLFNAIASQLANNKNVVFYWVGDGELRSEINSDNVIITGWLSRPEVQRYFQTASIYLATSQWEGLPYAVLEAMNAQCCLVLSDCGGHRDLVKPGQNGFLFNSAEQAVAHIEWLLADAGRIARMGIESRRICAAEFDASKMAEGYNALYCSLK